jgi:alkylation response protein AidB-like acyl-CoA dehydrogenase
VAAGAPATGAPHASYFTFNCVLHEGGQPLRDVSGALRVHAFIVPAAGVWVLPTWHTIGLRASASHGFEIRGLVVPHKHAFDIEPTAATQGSAHGNSASVRWCYAIPR